MIKSTFIAILLLTGTASSFQCNKDKNRGACLKGEVIDAMCASYIIKITEGNYDPSLVQDSWQDPQTGNTYTNVFAIANICDLQGKLVAGDKFSFRFTDASLKDDCNTCMAIRPTPSKVNKIRLTTSCND